MVVQDKMDPLYQIYRRRSRVNHQIGKIAYEIDAACSFPALLTHVLDAKAADRLLLACRAEQMGNKWRACFPESTKFVRTCLSKYILASFFAKAWPVTRMMTDKQAGLIFVLEFNKTVARIMSDCESDLFKWENAGDRALPEDLCLYREGAALPVFCSVTHERMAWYLGENLPPGIAGVKIKLEDIAKHIPNGKHFCEKTKRQ